MVVDLITGTLLEVDLFEKYKGRLVGCTDILSGRKREIGRADLVYRDLVGDRSDERDEQDMQYVKCMSEALMERVTFCEEDVVSRSKSN